LRKSIILVFLLSVCIGLHALESIDSLWSVWNNESAPDTCRVQAINKIAYDIYLFSQPDSAFYFAQLQYDFARSRGLKKEMAKALNTQGISYYIRSDYNSSLEYYQRSLKLREEIKDIRGIGVSLVNIGMIYSNLGEYSKALDYYEQSLSVVENTSYKELIASNLGSIGKIHKHLGDYPGALNHYMQSYEIYKEIFNKKGMSEILNKLGSIYMDQGLYPKAIDHYQQSLQIKEKISDKRGMAGVLNNIGLIYLNRKENTKALDYFQRSLRIKEELSDKNGMAITLNNIGLVYKKWGNHKQALDYYLQSLGLREKISDKRGMAGTLNNIGEVFMDRGDNQKALEHFHRSLSIYQVISNKRGMPITLINIGKLSNNKGNHSQAIAWCKKALNVADEISAIESQKGACNCLYVAYKAMGNGAKALLYHERVSLLEDRLQAKETTKKLQQMEFRKQILADSLMMDKEKLNIQRAHEAKLRQKKRARNLYILLALFIIIFVIGFYKSIEYNIRVKKVIQNEKYHSDKLLLNILPNQIAEELKVKGHADARNIKNVSILFTDFEGFTRIAELLNAEELVEEINSCFKAFDAICKKYGVEKIKTIGDAYMAAGGIPVPGDDSVKMTVLAGLEMIEFMRNKKQQSDIDDNICFEMRVGIHTGPVVAGIVGDIKFLYDIWGDAVNMASLMENTGEVGKVNISRSTFEMISDDPSFQFLARGMVKTKGKGEVEMWFVEKVG